MLSCVFLRTCFILTGLVALDSGKDKKPGVSESVVRLQLEEAKPG